MDCLKVLELEKHGIKKNSANQGGNFLNFHAFSWSYAGPKFNFHPRTEISSMASLTPKSFIEIEVTSLYDIFFQHHNDVVAITKCNVKLHVIVIPIFNAVLISDKDENAILFHLSKYSDKLYGNIVCKMQIEMSNL